MNQEPSGEHFLHYNNPRLHAGEEVAAVVHYLTQNGEHIPQRPVARIQAYLGFMASSEYVNDGILTGDSASIDRQAEYHSIRPEDVPESYFELQERILYEQGYGHVTLTEHDKEESIDAIREDQAERHKSWAEYISDPENEYEDWFKYYVMHNVTSLSQYDPAKENFKRRSRTTTEPVPELNPEAIGLLLDAIVSADYRPDQSNFTKLYKQALQQAQGTLNPELLKQVEGEWKTYQSGKRSDVDSLVDSLQGKCTSWCTAGRSVARYQLQNGDFHVFYTYDEAGEATVPRIAIRMQHGQVAEMRGVLAGQNIEGELLPTAIEKAATLPGSERFLRAEQDMQLLTGIMDSMNHGRELSPTELRFLYQLDRPIVGFGLHADPRIAELKSKRNRREDYATIYGVEPNQVATTFEELDDTTTLYVGEFPVSRLGKRGFSKYPNLRQFTIEPSFRSLSKARFTSEDAKWLIDRGLTGAVLQSKKLFIDVSYANVIDMLAENPAQFEAQGDRALKLLPIYREEPFLDQQHFELFLHSTTNPKKLLESVHIFRDIDERAAVDAIFEKSELLQQPIDILMTSFGFASEDMGMYVVQKLFERGDALGALHVETSIKEDKLSVLMDYSQRGYSAQVAQIASRHFGHWIDYGKNPEGFTALIETLVADGHADKLIHSLTGRSPYGGVAFPEAVLLEILTRHNRVDLIIANAEKFNTLNKRQVADMAKANLEQGSTERIITTLQAKRKISLADAQTLIQDKRADLVLKHHRQITGLDRRALMTQLLESDQPGVIDVFPSAFKDTILDRQTLQRLQELGRYRFIASNPANFEQTTQQEVIELLLESGNGIRIIEHLERYTKIDSETTQILIDRYGLTLGQIKGYKSSFVFGDAIAALFMQNGQAEFVIDNLGSFDLSPSMLAEAWRKVL